MIFSLMAFAFMVVAHLLFAGDLENSTKIKFWLVFFVGGIAITYLFNAPFIAVFFKVLVAVTYVFKGYSASNTSGEI